MPLRPSTAPAVRPPARPLARPSARPFRPLELSIYVPGNELPALPNFLSPTTLDREEKRRKRTSSLPVIPALHFSPASMAPRRPRARTNTLTIEHKAVTVPPPSAPLPSARPSIVGNATSPVPPALVPGPPSARTQSFYAQAGAMLLASTLASANNPNSLRAPLADFGPSPTTAGTAASALSQLSPLDEKVKSPAFSFMSTSEPPTHPGSPTPQPLARRVTSPVQMTHRVYPQRSSSLNARTVPVPIVNLFAPTSE